MQLHNRLRLNASCTMYVRFVSFSYGQKNKLKYIVMQLKALLFFSIIQRMKLSRALSICRPNGRKSNLMKSPISRCRVHLELNLRWLCDVHGVRCTQRPPVDICKTLCVAWRLNLIFVVIVEGKTHIVVLSSWSVLILFVHLTCKWSVGWICHSVLQSIPSNSTALFRSQLHKSFVFNGCVAIVHRVESSLIMQSSSPSFHCFACLNLVFLIKTKF